MIVEHVFVTTLEAPDALRTASQFLMSRGFEANTQSAFQIGADAWNVLEMRRGKKSASRAKSAIELPQQMRLEYDRGRVTLALSALSVAESRATSNKPKAAEAREIGNMLTVLAQNLEHLLANRTDPATAHARWAQFETQLHQEGLRRKRRRLILLLTLLGVIIALIVAIAVLASSS